MITVIGGGNSALEEASYLTQFASKVNVLVRNELRADKNIQDEAYANDKIEIMKKIVPLEILDDGKRVNGIRVKNVVTNEEYVMETSAVFPYVGSDPITSYAKDLGICDEHGYIVTDEEMATAVEGIFAAGDVRKKTIRQVVTAAGDGAITLKSMMKANDYQKQALRTLNPSLSKSEVLINGVMGLCGESGEVIDLVKKHLAQGHELNREKLAKELGDVAWYLAETAYALDYDLESIFQMNLDKLAQRYPDGFEKEKSMNRNDETDYVK